MASPDTPDAFEDVNEAVGEEWEAETTPYGRVRQTIRHRVRAGGRGDRRGARTHLPENRPEALGTLADEGFVATEAGEHGGTTYRRSPESLVVEQAAEILAAVSVDELADRIGEMRESIRAFREEYGVESLRGVRGRGDERNPLRNRADRDGTDAETLRAWRTTRRNLAFANAERFVGDEERPSVPGVSAR